MLQTGWQVVSTDRDESAEHGDSVFWGLERGGTVIQLEYYEHGQLVAYPLGRSTTDDTVTEPLFSLEGSTQESSRRAFTEMGWLSST